jgi:hypothetical protein
MSNSAQTDFTFLSENIRQLIAPVRPADANTISKHDFLFSGIKSVETTELPAPYLIYFLLVELLNFKDLGRFEKLAWSIPVDFNGRAFLIEHRKFGVGIFVQTSEDHLAAKEIAQLIRKGIQLARPFFDWKASAAVSASKFNVVNSSSDLLGRYNFLKQLHQDKIAEAEKCKDEIVVTEVGNGATYSRPYVGLTREGNWLGFAAIEAFFSWTEHVFVHFAVLQGLIKDGDEFLKASGNEWGKKFKLALDISDQRIKSHYDRLIDLRRQVRNFIAHGAFGKNGETLRFHSNAGAVPVVLDVSTSQTRFSLGDQLSFDLIAAFLAIENFKEELKTGASETMWTYVQEYGLPLILTMAHDGTYRAALQSTQSMIEFCNELSSQMDDATNMDW